MSKFVMEVALVLIISLTAVNAETVELPLQCAGKYKEGQKWVSEFNLGITFTEISNVYVELSGTITAEEVRESEESSSTWPLDGKFVVQLFTKDYKYEIANAYVHAGQATYPFPESFKVKLELPELIYESGAIMLRFEDGTLNRDQMEELLASYGGGKIDHIYNLPGLCYVKLPERITVQEAVEVLDGAEGILYAEPNYRINPSDWLLWRMFLDGQGSICIFFDRCYRSLNLLEVQSASGELTNATLVFEGAAIPEANEPTIRLVPDEYDTIQEAIDACLNHDIVVIKPGRYTGPGNRDIDFKRKAITLRSADPTDTNVVRSTIIDCNGTDNDEHRAFLFRRGEGADSIISGFTITNGYASYVPLSWALHQAGGAIACLKGSSPTIKNCMFTGNTARYGSGGAVYCDYSSPTIINCTFYKNLADIGGGLHCSWCGPLLANCVFAGNEARQCGGAFNHSRCTPTIINCTFSGNRAGSRWGGAINGYDSDTIIANSIFWGDTPGEISDQSGTIALNYSSIQKGWPGQGNIDADPCFVDPNNGDYHLQSQAGRWDPITQSWVQDDVTSPCIDAGDPNNPIGLEPFPNGGIINMGAYGGTAEASKSYFGEPVCETIVAGDINGDCKVDFIDLELMAFNWLEER